MSFFEKLKNGLLKTKNAIFGGFESIFGKRKIDDELLDELEELLITSDIGVGPTEKIIDELRERVRQNRIRDAGEIKDTLREILTEMIGEAEPLALEPSPAVILVIGVNGVGKTTSIAKIANLLKSEG
ncbi:MAG: signal recognition particle receptor subunit alpha, partial [Clostridia bacterium]|nr:signal recognition particle receptor subunit alpha [Clostridia bacterium]